MHTESQAKNKVRFTPRELIKYHIDHPNEPITDEHINNLVLESFFETSIQKRGKSSSVAMVYDMQNKAGSYPGNE